MEPYQTIASFTVDHTKLQPGLYLSRQDGAIHSYDLRFCKPNSGQVLDVVTLHSIEHLLATVLRNSPQGANVVYFGPMGCQTGFYLLVQGLDYPQGISLLQQALTAALAYDGPMPGASAKECGNYRTLDLAAATAALKNYQQVIAGWTVAQLAYE